MEHPGEITEFCNKTVTTLLSALLSRDHSTLIKRLQHSYQETAALLSRDCSTLIKRSQHSYQEIAVLLSRDRSTPIKRSQHSYQEIAALLSRDRSTLIKRLQHCQQNDRILKFLSPVHFTHITILPVRSNKNVLKNGRKYHNFWDVL